MKVGISTACFYPDENTEDTLKIIKKLGFNTFEAFLESEFEMNPDYCKNLKEEAHKLGLNIFSVHPFSAPYEPYLFDRYPRRRLEMLERFKMACRACRVIGAKYYIFHGITNTGAEINADEIADNMDELCSIAEENGVKLAWENVSWCRSCSPDFINIIKAQMKKNIYFNLDVKQAVRSNRSPMEYIDVYGDKLVNVHINDCTSKSSCLLPGSGNADLKGMIEEIKKINNSIPLIIEVYRNNFSRFEEVEASRRYIENMIK